MTATFIIALYDRNSPLRAKQLDVHRTLGLQWSEKHRAKNITPFLLFRIGAVWGFGPGIASSPKYAQQWGLYPIAELEAKYDVLIGKLQSKPYGIYDAMAYLFGQAKAHETCADKRIPSRHAIPMIPTK